MKFDPRIKSIDSIRSFNTNNYDCLGKFGYFTNYVENFENLSEVRKGICVFKDGCRFPFHADSIENQKFQFFIPEKDLLPKEKQYREYTIDEFQREFTIGNIVTFRHKVNRNSEYRTIYNGYHINSEGEFMAYLGIWKYTLQELFDYYELLNSATAKWQPFGVEVEE